MTREKIGQIDKVRQIDKIGARDYPVTVDGYLRRLLEVNNQMDAIRCELERIVRLLLPDVKPELSFDDNRRRIYWNGGSIKLGKKSYLFVKTLWLGERHRAELAELEENVWTQQVETEAFVARRTISMLVQHTQKNLIEADFPYKIETVKKNSSQELEGFQLVLLNNQKKMLPSQMRDML